MKNIGQKRKDREQKSKAKTLRKREYLRRIAKEEKKIETLKLKAQPKRTPFTKKEAVEIDRDILHQNLETLVTELHSEEMAKLAKKVVERDTDSSEFGNIIEELSETEAND